MISNKTLGIIIITTIIISLSNQVYILNLQDSTSSKINGFATQSGTAQINIQQDATIILYNDTINWGTGLINTTAGCTNATLQTGTNINDTDAQNLNNCWTGNTTNEDFKVKSLANIAIKIDIQSTENSTDFFNVSGSEYQFQTFNITGTSCSSYITSWQDFNKSNQDVCTAGNFSTNSEFGVVVRIVVPSTVPTGAKTSSVTFTASPA